MAPRLPLRHYRSVPAFLRDTMAVRRQLATAGLRPLLGETRFGFFPLPGRELPLSWGRMKAPLLSP